MSWAAAEKGILAAHRVGDFSQCTALAVKFGAPFIKAYLRKSLKEEVLVEDSFSEWCELVATSWPEFDPSQKVATWLYVLTRRPKHNASREKIRNRQQVAVASELAAEPRSSTSPHMRTTVKNEFRALWAELDVTDREILRLRIEEGLGWEAVAEALHGPGWAPSASERKRELQNLAARFKRRIKDALADKAYERGLLEKHGLGD